MFVALAAIEFPEAASAVPEVEAAAQAEAKPEAVEVLPVEEMIPAEKQVPVKKDARKVVEEEEEDEHAKDGVSSGGTLRHEA